MDNFIYNANQSFLFKAFTSIKNDLSGAKEHCQGDGGDLVKIDTQDKQHVLQSYLGNILPIYLLYIDITIYLGREINISF